MPSGAPASGVSAVLAYHDRTKHHIQRFAAGPGGLDWATQPDPFRRYPGAPLLPLPQQPAGDAVPAPLSFASAGDLLRCALGLTAWKAAGGARWALRANPSSGNLHPTEGYVVAPGLAAPGWRVCHYAPRAHALEVRAELAAPERPRDVALVGLTSIHWREAWKYGERAFRYCQHDVGHAIGAVAYAAALLGWRVRLLPRWTDDDIAALLGVRHADGPPPEADGPEPEHPDVLLAVGPGDVDACLDLDPEPWVRAARAAVWIGAPNQLSPSRREWPAIEAVAAATWLAREGVARSGLPARPESPPAREEAIARDVLLRRRSAVAFDGRSALSRDDFRRMLAHLMPGGIPGDGVHAATSPVWSAPWWRPSVQLVWFVHRVEGVTPGLYAQVREAAALDSLRAGLRQDLLWEPVPGLEPLRLLAPFDTRAVARRLSCDQDIAADGYLGLAMLAPLDTALASEGPAHYRRLFWECGLIGQVLYLEAERAGGRSTGIGCYYDDAVHQILGIEGHGWQSLYHFSMGTPVDDARLSTEPGYSWEAGR